MTVTVTAKVRKDGLLAIPKKARERLALRAGDEVQVCVEVPEGTATEQEENPLWGIIGLGKAGHADGAENHDKYLYGRE